VVRAITIIIIKVMDIIHMALVDTWVIMVGVEIIGLMHLEG
jgi:hypothetical protein